MKRNILNLIAGLMLSGCTNIISVDDYSKVYERNLQLTGFHSFYLGSDQSYHYLKVGNVMRSSFYRIRKEELTLKEVYPYNELSPTETFIEIKGKQ